MTKRYFRVVKTKVLSCGKCSNRKNVVVLVVAVIIYNTNKQGDLHMATSMISLLTKAKNSLNALSITDVKKLSAIVLSTLIFSTAVSAAQLPIPVGGVGYANRLISIYDLFRDNLPSNLIGQVTTDANGYYQVSIPYNPSLEILFLVYDTNNIQIPKVTFFQAVSSNYSDAGQHQYLSHEVIDNDPPIGMLSNGNLIIKGRAITFSNGTYGLYSCVAWLSPNGSNTYCDPNAVVGTLNTITISQLPVVPKTRAQVAAENAENTPKRCVNLKVVALIGGGANITSNTPYSCSFSISNAQAGQWAVRAEITEKSAGAVQYSAGGTNIFTVGTNGKMNGKVDYDANTQEWILTQTP